MSASFTDFTYKKHSHEEYALGVTLRGVQQYNLDGSFQSSHASGVMLFNPEQIHDGRSQYKTGIDYVMLYIHPDHFTEVLEKRDLPRFTSPIVYNADLKQKILRLAHAISNGKDESFCSELLLTLVESFSEAKMSPEAYKTDHHLTKKAKEMMYYSIDNVLRLDDICKEFGMSKFQFIRAFKANTGISPYQFFLNCKVEYAKKLIESTKDIYLAVTECGFADLTHLNRHFKRVYGTTAFEYLTHIN